MMTVRQSLPSVLLIVFLSLKSTQTVCRSGMTFDSLVKHMSDNIDNTCSSESTTINVVKDLVPSVCCAFNSSVCERARRIYTFFYDLRENPTSNSNCLYNIYILFFSLCKCPSNKVPPKPGTGPPHEKVPKDREKGSNGQEASPCKFPWVALFSIADHRCSGVIIDSETIFTAAHCTKYGKASEMLITFNTNGEQDNSYEAFVVGVKSVTVHPGFIKNDRNSPDDIAIVSLSKDIPFTECFLPISLPDEFNVITNTTECVTAGWGKSESKWSHRHLRKAKQPIINKSLCKKLVKEYQPGILCAGYSEGRKDTCVVDSGGPLMCPSGDQWVLAGIISHACADEDAFGIYADVKYYMEWIMNNLNEQGYAPIKHVT